MTGKRDYGQGRSVVLSLRCSETEREAYTSAAGVESFGTWARAILNQHVQQTETPTKKRKKKSV